MNAERHLLWIQLIRDVVGITHDEEARVGYYVGLLHSSFFLAEAIGVFCLGGLSDRVGRKPVILVGLTGITVSSLSFGLSKTLWGLILSRCLCGALNGNVSVVKSMLSELTDTENLPTLWGLLPLAWTIGATLGPVIGGYISRPAERFPQIFGNVSFLKIYPYFLPCAFPAVYSAFAWMITFYLLKETVKSPISMRSILTSGRDGGGAGLHASPKTSFRSVLNSKVVVSVGIYAFVALLEVSYRALQPVFFATPIDFGGLDLSPPSIGNILSLSGAFVGLSQILVFPFIHRLLGDKSAFIVAVTATIPLFLTFPAAHRLVKKQGFTWPVWLIITIQSMLPLGFGLAFGSIFIYITAAAPNKASLGATHGLSQMTISFVRAIGPASANALFSLSMEHGYLGGNLVYYALFVVTCIGLVGTDPPAPPLPTGFLISSKAIIQRNLALDKSDPNKNLSRVCHRQDEFFSLLYNSKQHVARCRGSPRGFSLHHQHSPAGPSMMTGPPDEDKQPTSKPSNLLVSADLSDAVTNNRSSKSTTPQEAPSLAVFDTDETLSNHPFHLSSVVPPQDALAHVLPDVSSLITFTAPSLGTQSRVSPEEKTSSLSLSNGFSGLLSTVPGASTLSAAQDISSAIGASKLVQLSGSSLPETPFSAPNLSSVTGALQSPSLIPHAPPLSSHSSTSTVTLVSESFSQKLPSLEDLPKAAGLSTPAAFSALTDVAFSSAPLSSKLSNLASSPFIPAVPGMALISEVTPLLQSVRRIPWFQVAILMFLQMVEPLTTHVVSPFTPELIRAAIGNYGTDEQLGYVAESLQSFFYFMEASTVLYWSRTSDKVGRKPVILIGLVGSSLSMMCFGISQSLWGSLISMMAEMVDTADLARIYAFTPLAHSAGASIGPIINDYLSPTPKEGPPASDGATGQSMVPNLLTYLLASSTPTLLSILSFTITFFFLKETVKSPAPVSTLLKPLPIHPGTDAKDPEQNEHHNPLDIVADLHLRAPQLQDGVALGGAVASAVVAKLPFDPNKLMSMRAILTPHVIIAVGNFACLTVIETTFRSIQTLFLANPMALGGLGLPDDQIQSILSAYSVLNGCVQMMFFAQIHSYLGSKKTFLYGVASAVPLFLTFPVTSFLAKTIGPGIFLWMALGVQVILPIGFNLAFGSIFMYITASSPTPEALGTTNGLSEMLANSMRGIAPGIATGLFTLSIERDYMGGNLVYVVLALIAAVATVAATFLPHKLWTREQ
ncbi:hypothetical protein H0H92_011732 [Tricholoma furcatifolium]|nr:hypothetical protein H0H92_011732 [Tricholoma furcatifolium]